MGAHRGLGAEADARRRGPAPAPVAEIARRVEALRGLRFDAIPRPVAVTPAQARREGLEDLDRSYPEARRRADEEVLKLLGLIEPAVDLRDVSASVFSEGVAGYYDPRTKRMRIVRGAATGTRVLAEMVLAHELTHALEDQRFGLGARATRAAATTPRSRGWRSWRARASELMYAYARRHFAPEETLGGVLGTRVRRHRVAARRSCRRSSCSRTPAGRRSSSPARARRRALDARGPRRALAAARHDRAGHASGEVAARRAAAAGADWARGVHEAAGGAPRRTLGRVADARAARARGRRRVGRGRRRLGRGPLPSSWRRRAGRGLRGAVPARAALVVRWRWDTPADAREFAAKLRLWVRDGLGAHVAGRRHLRDRRRARRLAAERGEAVRLAMAPSGAEWSDRRHRRFRSGVQGVGRTGANWPRSAPPTSPPSR